MHNIYLKDLVKLSNGKLIMGDENTPLINFSKDTRTMEPNDIYIGIKGENFDGNTLYKEAFEKGALGCIINDNIELDREFLSNYSDRFLILVSDTIKAIQSLAKYKRSLYDILVVGVTGSVGKTSTKDIIASVLSQKYNVLKTEGNYNNHIGVPLTILRLKDENALVVEMGMNSLGEISSLSQIAKPSISVITNVGTAHIGNLGSRENILKAKLEILDGMDKDGVLVINNDNDLLHDYYIKNKDNRNIITFGINNISDYKAYDIETKALDSSFKTDINNKTYNFKINIPGEHFVLNALCALALGSYLKIDTSKIELGIESFSLTKRRMEINNINSYVIINDCYNANLDSMTSAINYLGTLKGRKVAVLGDMLELGDYSEKLHRAIAQVIIDNKIDLVITVGEESKYIKNELNRNNYNNIESFDNNLDAFNKIKESIKKGDNILLKASYGMKFIEIYNYLVNYIK